MERAYSILMFCFAAALALYGALVAQGRPDLIRRRWAVKMKNPKAYAKQFGKVIALVSLAPLSSGIVGLLFDINRRPLLPVATLIIVMVVCIWIGVRWMENVT